MISGYFADRYFRILKRTGNLKNRLLMIISRRKAHRARREFVRVEGKSVLTPRIKKAIKEYARERFGSKAFWPYLALYTEARGGFIRGWIPFDYFLYDLEPRLNPPIYKELGNLKTFDYRLFGDFAVKPLFLYISGIFLNSDYKVIDQRELKKILADHGQEIVVKQEFGWGGNQVRFIHASEFTTEMLQKGTNYVIQPLIRQYKVLNDLCPDSVNTLRVTTFLKRDGSIDIVFVILRFGVDGSRVDNLVAGGQCISMDSEGRPSRIAYDDLGHEGGETHRNTGFRFADLHLPMFPDVIARCKTEHQKYPYIRLIGWDVCIDETGTPRLLEWNTGRPTFDMEDALLGPFFPDDSEF